MQCTGAGVIPNKNSSHSDFMYEGKKLMCVHMQNTGCRFVHVYVLCH